MPQNDPIKLPKGFEDATVETVDFKLPSGFEDAEVESVDSKKKVPTEPDGMPTQSGSATSDIGGEGDPRAKNPRAAYLEQVVQRIAPGAPKRKEGQSLSDYGKELNTYGSKAKGAKPVDFSPPEPPKPVKEQFVQFIDEQIANIPQIAEGKSITELPEEDANLYIYKEYLKANNPDKLKRFEDKLNYKSVLPYALDRIDPAEREKLKAEFYDEALQVKQTYLNIKLEKLSQITKSPEVEKLVYEADGIAGQIKALNASYESGNIDEANYKPGYDDLTAKLNAVQTKLAPIRKEMDDLSAAWQKNVTEAEGWVKRYPLEAKRRLEEKAKDVRNDVIYETNPQAKIFANTTFQIGQAVTNFVAKTLAIPQITEGLADATSPLMAGVDRGYNWKDRLADVAGEWADEVNKEFLPTPSKLEKPLIERNQYGQMGFSENFGSLIIPKTVRTLADMGIMMGGGLTGAGTAGTVAASYMLTAKDFYDEAIDAGMSEKGASTFSTAMGMTQGMLELINPEAALVRKQLAKVTTKRAAELLTSKMSMGEVIKESTKAVAGNIAKENTQELTQMFAEKAGKYAANQITDADFDLGDIQVEVAETVLLTSIVSGISGLSLSGAKNNRSELEKRAIYSGADNPELIFSATKKAVDEGRMTETEAMQVNNAVSNLKANLDVLPTNILESEKVEIVNGLFDKMKLLQMVDNPTLDPAISKLYADKIKAIDSGIAKITSKYINNETTSPRTVEELSVEEPVVEVVESVTTKEPVDDVAEPTPQTNVSEELTLGELIDNVGVLNGERGRFYQDGQAIIFKVDGQNREIELGNIDELKNEPISKFGIETEQSVVSTNDNGDILIRENNYVNNFSDPLMAINKDVDGNVISVNLETPDGKKRTFKGVVAEDIAYQIHLKEINKNNESKSEFERFITNDESISIEIINAEIPETSKETTTTDNAEISREKIELPPTAEGTKEAITSQQNEQEVNQKGRQEGLLNESAKTEPVSEVEAQKAETEKRIEASNKRIDSIAKTIKDILKVDVVPGAQKMGSDTGAIIDMIAQASKHLVNKGIKTQAAIEQVIKALRDAGHISGKEITRMRNGALSSLDEESEKVWVTKSGKYTLLQNSFGDFEVRDDKDKPVTKKSIRKSVISEYVKGKDLTKGELANLEGIQEKDANRFIAENSKNPMQVAQAMAFSNDKISEDQMDYKEQIIAQHLPFVKRSSFVNENDESNLIDEKDKFQEGTAIQFNYLRANGLALDEAAEAVNSGAGQENGDVTEQDIVDFILKYPKGKSQFYGQANPDYLALKNKFHELTGFNATPEILEQAKDYTEVEGEDFGGLEPAEGKEGADVIEEPKEKTRGLAKQDMSNPKISGESKAMISNADKKYIVQTNKMSIGEARAIISRVGAEVADEMVRDKNNGMNGGVRSALSQGLKMYYEKTGQYEKMISLTKWMYYNSTDVGQEIQMMSRFAEITPDYTFESSEKLYKDATRSAENPDGLPMPEYLKNYFDKLAKETAALQKKYDELKAKQDDKSLQNAVDNINESHEREKKTPKERKAALSEEKAKRKKELRAKFAGVFHDFTDIPRLLADKEFYEYNKLIVEEAVNDFKSYVKILVDEMGGKARQYARELYVAGGGTELPDLPKPYYDEQGNLKISPQLIREIVAKSDKKLKADELVSLLKEEVIKDLPDVTDLEIKEAITGYGKTVNPSKDAIDAEVRRLKRDARLELGLKDALAGLGVKLTGLLWDKPTDYQRDLERKIKEELKNHPADQAEVQKKWASALDRTKTHLKNQIADITKRIEDIENGVAEPIPSKKRGFELDEEAKELQAHRDELKKALLELEPKQEMSDEQRIKIAIAAVERAIQATADKIANRDLEYKKRVTLDSPEIKAAKERLKQGKDVLKRMREEEGFAKEHAYKIWKKRIGERIAKLEKQIKDKDFAVKPKNVEEPMTDEQFKLKVKLENLKFERDVAIEKVKQKELVGWDWWQNKIADIVGLPKALMASADLSAPLRQGAVLSAKHPIVAARAMKEMFSQLFSEAKQKDWISALHATESYPYMKHAKLFLSEPSVKLAAKEEDFASNIAEKIPIWGKVVKGSSRAYTAYLNKLRVDVFNQYYEALKRDGFVGAELEKELDSYAKFINNATGRGHLGRLETSALILNSAFFSPRYVASRFNLMNPVYYAKMTPRVRMDALKTVGTYIGVSAMTLALINAMGGDDDDGKDMFTIEIDPRSSDFGKLKWGDTRFDIWSGFQQFVRLFTQIAKGEKVTVDGSVVKLGEGYKADDKLDVIGKFLRSKASPAVGTALNIISGKDMMGQEVTIKDELLKSVIPLYVSDMHEVYQMEGAGKAVVTALPAIFGVGVQTYTPKEKKPLTKEDVQKIMDKRLDEIIDSQDALKVYEKKQKSDKAKVDNAINEAMLKQKANELNVPYYKP